MKDLQKSKSDALKANLRRRKKQKMLRLQTKKAISNKQLLQSVLEKQ